LAVDDADSLYQQLQTINWGQWFGVDRSFSIDFSGQNESIRNTHFGAQRSKDAIVDWFVAAGGRRPSVARRDPDVRLNVRLVKGRIRVSLDFSGGSLHRRGYRLSAGEAPLKENLAAAILLRAGWPAIAAEGGALIDPMCGAATLLLEGAMMAADMAPGLRRERFGFHGWVGHNETQWQAILADARGRAARGLERELPEIRGYDADPQVIRRAQENTAVLGFEKIVRVSCKSLAEFRKPTHKMLQHGLLVCNPPYGERLGDKRALSYLYRQLGELMLAEFPGWQAAIFTADLELGRATGLRSHKQFSLWNGALSSSLLLFDLNDNELRGPRPAAAEAPPCEPTPAGATTGELSAGAVMFANRVRKNRKRFASWVKREGIDCYRVYDADMPEYAVAVDIYGACAQVAEYRAPDTVAPQAAAKRLEEVIAALPEALGIDPENIAYKQRSRQRGSQQYEKRADRGELISVVEGRARFLVNLHDYLDTGLFLDHRPLRRRIAEEAKGTDFLNLFCYTGSATVHAALAGARTTTSVDLSNTYLGWLRKNLAHNGLGEARNFLHRADCLQWLEQQHEGQYDLILLDPPSFSNSSGMTGNFDVQRDHPDLLRRAMRVLRDSGQLYFSCNRRGFKLDQHLQAEFHCEDITAATLDPDFRRNPKIHVCWRLRWH
jgi:23S rRNA (guanine2445-N2)-methyltransferase / 23S rRNA (guanine2069-N7)-methyltransferase